MTKKQIKARISSFLFQSLLPKRKKIQPGYEPTYYGASYVIAKALKLKTCNPSSCYVWTHGCRLVGSDDVRYYIRFPQLKGNILVARQDEKHFLEDAGFSHVHAVGMPIAYTQQTNERRRKNSLLVMPPHATLHSRPMQEIGGYLDFVCGLREKFSIVACCVSRQCYQSSSIRSLFMKRGIPVIVGAAIDDGNSLARTRSILESFEYVTTNAYGSHLAYAMAFGAKVSLAGPIYWPSSGDLRKEPFYQENPDLIDQSFLKEQVRRLKKAFERLCVDPWRAEQNILWGRKLIGANNVSSHREVGKLLGLAGA